MKRPKTIEDICIQKIQKGIKSIQNGHRTCEEVHSDIQFCLDKLKGLNEGMYTDLLTKYNATILSKMTQAVV